jgi:hypothetical protein
MARFKCCELGRRPSGARRDAAAGTCPCNVCLAAALPGVEPIKHIIAMSGIKTPHFLSVRLTLQIGKPRTAVNDLSKLILSVFIFLIFE